MQDFPNESIDMCLTSPPYWGLRDYGHGGQYGLEKTPEEYIDKMISVFHEVKRVLKKEGTLWLNIGDTYFSKTDASSPFPSRPAQKDKYVMGDYRFSGMKEKCLCMIPERLAWSLIQDGWILRNKIVWYKPNGMPSSVTDRFSNKWEYIFLFSKSQKYYFDLDAVREATISPPGTSSSDKGFVSNVTEHSSLRRLNQDTVRQWHPLGKNPGDVFKIPTQPFPEAHFAVFPPKLCEKPIKAGCPEGGIVLDPFCGAGTTLYMAQEMKRNYIGIDINQEFIKMSDKRTAQRVL
jgi:site-specific DNA-methyltransferase (cytosine-N4-specific)